MDNLKLIERAMQARGIDRAELAKKTGISPGLIGRYLSGKIKVGVKNAPRIAEVLGLEKEEVLFGQRQVAASAA
jgi:transcriptional regulator with XRE-family HTH domain